MWASLEDPDPDERYVGKVANPTKVMVWGAVSYNGRSALHFFDGKVKSDQYCAAVGQAFLGRSEKSHRGHTHLYDKEWLALDKDTAYTFQQDGARCHTSKKSEAWLEKNLPSHWHFTPKDAWPANSPDLSIIENVWAILQDRVIEREAFTEEKLVKVLEEEWWALPQDTIRKLYDDIPRRMTGVIQAKGGRVRNR